MSTFNFVVLRGPTNKYLGCLGGPFMHTETALATGVIIFLLGYVNMKNATQAEVFFLVESFLYYNV